MMFNWKTYYLLAVDLKPKTLVEEIDKAKCRSSVSRAYYACLSLARKYIIENDNKDEKWLKNHGNICEYFAEIKKDDIYITITSNLWIMYRNRIKADYNDRYIRRLGTMAKNTLKIAQVTLELIDDL